MIGAGDSAIENAVALAEHNEVIIVNRRGEFARAKERNATLIEGAIASGEIVCYYSALPVEMTRTRIVLETPQGNAEFECERVLARLGATPPRRLVESLGVQFPDDDVASLPEVNLYYESNVPGLHIVGALSGYPLIKQALNQGYEVTEYIRSERDLQPADEPFLQRKFTAMGDVSVDNVLFFLRNKVELFKELNPLGLRELVLESEIITPEHGDMVFDRDKYTDSFNAILSGSVDVQPDPKDLTQAVRLRAGQYFGEMSLIRGVVAPPA